MKSKTYLVFQFSFFDLTKKYFSNLFHSNSQDRNLDWFPRLRAMSLAADEGEAEQIELRSLQSQLETTQFLVTNLSQQLSELRDQVNNDDLFII